jgi:hypothetical protein
MANVPRFSIVLPTIGRVEYLTDAIESIRWQSFRDFELIISDNSDDGRVRSIADEYRHDDQVRYVRPPEQLNMPDHWEFASLHANGEFVFILQDRIVMLPNALLTADREIVRFSEQASVVYWPQVSNYDHRNGRVSRIESHTATSELRDPREVIGAFARFEIPRTHMPHASNGFYHRDLAGAIRRRHGRLFMPLAPDDAAGFLQLAYAEKLLFLDQPLWLGRLTTQENSNGIRAQLAGTHAYASSVGLPDFLSDVPLPVDTILNCIIYDLLAVKRLVDPRLSSVQLDLERYSVAIYSEIVDKELAGSGLDTSSMYRQWEDFVSKLPLEARLRIKHEVAQLGGIVKEFKRLLARVGLQPSLSFLKAKLGRSDNRIWGRARYETILDAAFDLAGQKFSSRIESRRPEATLPQ